MSRTLTTKDEEKIPTDKATTYLLISGLYQKGMKEDPPASLSDLHAALEDLMGRDNAPSYSTIRRAVEKTKALLKKGKEITAYAFKDLRYEYRGGTLIVEDDLVFLAITAARKTTNRRRSPTSIQVRKHLRVILPKDIRLPSDRTIRRRMAAISANPAYSTKLRKMANADMNYPRLFNSDPGEFWQVDATDLDLSAPDSADPSKPLYLTTVVDVRTISFLAAILTLDAPTTKDVLLAILKAISNVALGGVPFLPRVIQFDRAGPHCSKVMRDTLDAMNIARILIPPKASKIQTQVENGHNRFKSQFALVTDALDAMKAQIGTVPGPIEIIRQSADSTLRERNVLPQRRLRNRSGLMVLREFLSENPPKTDLHSIVPTFLAAEKMTVSRRRLSLLDGAVQYVAPPGLKLGKTVAARIPVWWVGPYDFRRTLSVKAAGGQTARMIHSDHNPREDHPDTDLFKDWSKWSGLKQLCSSAIPTKVQTAYTEELPRPARSSGKAWKDPVRNTPKQKGILKELKRKHEK